MANYSCNLGFFVDYISYLVSSYSWDDLVSELLLKSNCFELIVAFFIARAFGSYVMLFLLFAAVFGRR